MGGLIDNPQEDVRKSSVPVKNVAPRLRSTAGKVINLEKKDVVASPLARLVAIRFSLMTPDDIVKLSVCGSVHPIERQAEVLSARLGLPASNSDRCSSCGADNLIDCEGHFGHISLPVPVYHPNHVTELRRILQKLCLNCGGMKKKNKRKATNGSIDKEMPVTCEQTLVLKDEGETKTVTAQNFSQDIPQRRTAQNFSQDIPQRRRKVKKETIAASYVVLSDDDDDDAVKVPRKVPRNPASSQLELSPEQFIELSSDDENDEVKEVIKIPRQLNTVNYNALLTSQVDTTKASPISSDACLVLLPTMEKAVEDSSVPENEDSVSSCKYCGGNKETFESAYPHPEVKVVKRRVSNNNNVQFIELRVRSDKKIPSDYWSSIESLIGSCNEDQHTRVLLPCEALSIIKKVSDGTLAELAMNGQNLRLESLILEALPVPPNCTRISENFNNIDAVQNFGSDPVTGMLKALLRKISKIRGARTGKPSLQAGVIEAEELQSLIAQYFRLKGAPKVPGNAEPQVKGSRLFTTNSQGSTWSKKLSGTILTKLSNYSARCTLVGDPYLPIEEIGLPTEMIGNLTVPERVNVHNLSRLQECVDAFPVGCSTNKLMLLVRGDIEFDLSEPKAPRTLEKGDILHRGLCNGDIIFANRPPSIHKHSLIAFKVRIQERKAIAINPLVCSPFSGDFDGDTLHVFVPQSVQARAEVSELLALQNQFSGSQMGRSIISLTHDALLGAYLLTSKHVFLNRSEMSQMAMWSPRELPVPAILKSPKGGPLWTGKQAFSMTLPMALNHFYSVDGEVLINNGELLTAGESSNWLRDGIISVLTRDLGVESAMEHLNSCSKMVIEWLSGNGFSLNLHDFGLDAYSHLCGRTNEIIEKVKCQTRCALKALMNSSCDDNKLVENWLISCFQSALPEVEATIVKYLDRRSPLLLMLNAGSKGSVAKIREQIGCLGLQLHRGKELVAIHNKNDLRVYSYGFKYPETSELSEQEGLIRSSFLAGLSPIEFYHHTVTSREKMLKQRIGMKEPGNLFKDLMLFLRDAFVGYDKTIRYRHKKQIIQFNYPDERSSVIPGEAVGVVAATSISKPAYELTLDSSSRNGATMELLQETLLQSPAHCKEKDRCMILRLKHCGFKNCSCRERRALEIQNHLSNITLEALTARTAILYDEQQTIKLGRTPWVCHIQLIEDELSYLHLTTEDIFLSLQKGLDNKRKGMKWDPSMLLVFSCSDSCLLGGNPKEKPSPCIHVSQNDSVGMGEEDRPYDQILQDALEFMTSSIIPTLLGTSIKGNPDIESAEIAWEDKEDPAHVPFRKRLLGNKNFDGELVVRVTLTEKCSKGDMGWNTLKDSCLPVLDIVDWTRSLPFNINSIRGCLGVEASRRAILQRIMLAIGSVEDHVNAQHLSLISDFQTHTGDVIGFTKRGLKSFFTSIEVCAPFVQGSFQGLLKRFINAAERGERDELDGIVTSAAWGKLPPVGSGADFELIWKESDIIDPKVELWRKVDIDEFVTFTAAENIQPENGPDEWHTASIADDDTDIGECVSPFLTMNTNLEEELRTDEWGKPSGGEQTGGWGEVPNSEPTCGWGEAPNSEPTCGWGEAPNNEPTCGWGEALNNEPTCGWGEPINSEPTCPPSCEPTWGEPTKSDGQHNDWVTSTPTQSEQDEHKSEESSQWHVGTGSRSSIGDMDTHNENSRKPMGEKKTGANLVPLGIRRKNNKFLVQDQMPLQTNVKIQEHVTPNNEPEGKGWGDSISHNETEEKGWGDSISHNETEEKGWGDSISHNETEEKGWADSTEKSLSSPEPRTKKTKVSSEVHARRMLGVLTEIGAHDPNDPKSVEIIHEIEALANYASYVLHEIYQIGDTLEAEHAKFIEEKIILHHPESEKKIGCGIKNIEVNNPKEYPESRCFFVVRHDGSVEDFSYHKCLKAYADKNLPPPICNEDKNGEDKGLWEAATEL